MFTKDSKSVVGIFGKSLSKQAVTQDDIRELGKSAIEHLNKSIVMKGRKDPRGAVSSIHKSCWYLDELIKAMEAATGVTLQKSAEQSNSVRDRIDSASDWINTANEKDIYEVLDGCVGALKTAISALTVAAESVTDDETVTKDRFSKVTERGIYKAWQHADGTWWDHDPKTQQIVQVQAPGQGSQNADFAQAKQERDYRQAQQQKKPGDSESGNGGGSDKEDGKSESVAQPKSPNQITLSKEQLHNTLTNGFYSVVSAGRNPNSPDEANLAPDDPKFKERHEQLRNDLDKMGYKYTEVVGYYGGEEPSFMVFHDEPEAFKDTDQHKIAFFVTHENDKSQAGLNALGKKYNQDSVLHGAKGRNELHFTSGKHAGKTCGGNGYQELPEAEDYFTAVPVKSNNTSKVQMDISECFRPGAPLSDDDGSVTKGRFSKRGVSKAWQHTDGTWWDHGDNGQITQVQAPGTAQGGGHTCHECGSPVDKPGICENCKNTMSAASQEGSSGLRSNKYKDSGEVSTLGRGNY